MSLIPDAIKAITAITAPEIDLSLLLRKDMREALNQFFSAHDFILDLNESAEFQRYKLQEELILLINEAYPRPSLSDLTIKEN